LVETLAHYYLIHQMRSNLNWQAFEGFHHLIRSGNELIRNLKFLTNESTIMKL
jgi:hypothetical protein